MREYVQIDLERRGDREPTLEEAFDRVERGSLSRRRFLALGGAAGAAAALTACVPRRAETTPLPEAAAVKPHGARVVVIGAGLAGTTAAYRLARAGVHVRCFEARDRIGGRCWTARGFDAEQTAEHGGEFIDTRHVHLLGLAKELGLTMEDLWKGEGTGPVSPSWVRGDYLPRGLVKETMRRISKAVTAMGHDIGVFSGARGKATDDAISYGTATRKAKQLDRLNMHEWLEAEVPGIDPRVIDYLNVVMAGWYGLDMPVLSALIWVDFFLIPAPGGDERWHVEGGNDQIPLRAAAALPDGVLRTEAPLETLVRRANGTYELRFGGNASSKPIIADFVILATPFTTLQDVDLSGAGLPERRQRAIDTLGMGTDVKLLLQYRKRPDRFTVQGGRWSGSLNHADPNYDTWVSTSTQAGASSIITVYAGGSGSATFADPDVHDWAPEDLTSTIVGQIDQVVPGTEAQFGGKAWLDYWTGDPWTRGSYAAFIPGQMTAYWKYLGSRERGIHFAGEHTSTHSQGYLNGGVESGQRAAIEVMKRLGIPIPRGIAKLPYSTVRR
jgi:monoamine oxidase